MFSTPFQLSEEPNFCSQMTTNLVSQAATMELNGVPNDVIHNLNPFTLLM